MRNLLFCATFSVLAHLPAQAVPVVVYNNGLGNGGSYTIGSTANEGIAATFQSAVTGSLSSIEIGAAFQTSGGGNAAGTGLIAGLYAADGAGLPGALVTLLTQNGTLPSALGPAAFTTFTAATPIILNAGTKYWVAEENQTTPSGFGWYFSAQSGTSGWAVRPTAPGPWEARNTIFLPALRVTLDVAAAGVPELDAVSSGLPAFFALGLMLCGTRRRRPQPPTPC